MSHTRNNQFTHSSHLYGTVFLCLTLLTVLTSPSNARILENSVINGDDSTGQSEINDSGSQQNNSNEDTNETFTPQNDNTVQAMVLPDDISDLRCNFDLISMYVPLEFKIRNKVGPKIKQICPNVDTESFFCCSDKDLQPLIEDFQKMEESVTGMVKKYEKIFVNIREVLGTNFSESHVKSVIGDKCRETFRYDTIERLLKGFSEPRKDYSEGKMSKFFGAMMTMHSSFPCNICDVKFSSSVDVDKKRLFVDINLAQVYFGALDRFGIDVIREIGDLGFVMSSLNCMINGLMLNNKYLLTSKTDEMNDIRFKRQSGTNESYAEEGIYMKNVEFDTSDNFFPNDTLFLSEILNVIHNLYTVSNNLKKSRDLESFLIENTQDFPEEYFKPSPQYQAHPINDRLLAQDDDQLRPADANNLDDGLYKKEMENMKVPEKSSFSDRLTIERIRENTNKLGDNIEKPRSPPRKFQGSQHFPNQFRVFKALRPDDLKYELETFDIWYVWTSDPTHILDNGVDFANNSLESGLIKGVFYPINELVRESPDMGKSVSILRCMVALVVLGLMWFK